MRPRAFSSCAIFLTVSWVGAILCLSCVAQGAEYDLYTKRGAQVSDYNLVIKKIRPGDKLDMGDGHSFIVIGRLGSGNTTQIFETSDHKALRVPIAKGKILGRDYRYYIRGFYNSYMELKGSGLPLVQLYSKESNPSRYLLVEKVDGKQFNLEAFATRSLKQLGITKSEQDQINRALSDFARSTWQYKSIGDLHEEQVVFTDSGWRILDTLVGDLTSGEERNVKVVGRSNKTVFDRLQGLPGDWRSSLAHEVLDERVRRLFEPCVVKRLIESETGMHPSHP